VTAASYDVVGLGNAIVDVIARAEDDFLIGHGMRKGAMALIEEPRAEAIYAAMGPAIEISGGSAANTIAGIASFGARAAFVGKVKDDVLGRAFAHDIRSAGVKFATPLATSGPSTARSYILVTPDGERTMNTYLGAAQRLAPEDVDPGLVAASAITYLEGYLWDPRDAKDAFVKAATLAHEARRLVALTLSDAFCVDRWRDEFLDLIRKRTVDVLFANEAELKSLYQTADFDTAVAALRADALASRHGSARAGVSPPRLTSASKSSACVPCTYVAPSTPLPIMIFMPGVFDASVTAPAKIALMRYLPPVLLSSLSSMYGSVYRTMVGSK